MGEVSDNNVNIGRSYRERGTPKYRPPVPRGAVALGMHDPHQLGSVAYERAFVALHDAQGMTAAVGRLMGERAVQPILDALSAVEYCLGDMWDALAAALEARCEEVVVNTLANLTGEGR